MRGIDISALLACLVRRARADVRNGVVTERGLARRAGLSRSHVHNVLCGARTLTPRTADFILRALDVAVEDLLEEERRLRAEAGEGWVDGRLRRFGEGKVRR